MAENSSLAATRRGEDWIKDNLETIKCYSFAAADLLFSSWMVIRAATPKDPVFWKGFEGAAYATAALWGCAMPPAGTFEDWYGGNNKKCQCAEVGGQLYVEFTDIDGNRIREVQSDPGEAKNIEETGTWLCTFISSTT